jgi:hypothetical protein
MKFLFVSSKVESRIEALNKSGKAGIALAQKAIRIIEKLTSGDFQNHMDVIGSYTKYGEKRIQHCRKYNLGCGYRLITLQRGETVFMPFLGTHDESHRWLESNSRLKDFNAGAGRMIRVVKKKPMTRLSKAIEKAEIVPDDSDLFKHLTDKDLRRVFSGLAQGAK